MDAGGCVSTYWNIECRRCGLSVFEDDYDWTRHHGDEFAELCASGLLSTKPGGSDAWRATLTNNFDRTINMARLDTGCAHDFEPRDEYGEWATPDMWPDWHPKSKTVEPVPAETCTGLGDGRCIG